MISLIFYGLFHYDVNLKPLVFFLIFAHMYNGNRYSAIMARNSTIDPSTI